MRALLDGDIFLFRSAFSAEYLDEEIAIARCKSMLSNCLDTVKATDYSLWLSDTRINNYRTKIDPSYKANRTQPPPRHYNAVKDYLINEWGGVISQGQEADDAMGIDQTSIYPPNTTIICTIDKDLKQVAGQHYNFVTGEFDTVTPQQGIATFYEQMLTGDRTDNIQGVEGIGKVKSGKLLAYCEDEQEMWGIVKDMYDNDEHRLLTNGRLLWIRKKPNEMWNLPNNI